MAFLFRKITLFFGVTPMMVNVFLLRGVKFFFFFLNERMLGLASAHLEMFGSHEIRTRDFLGGKHFGCFVIPTYLANLFGVKESSLSKPHQVKETDSHETPRSDCSTTDSCYYIWSSFHDQYSFSNYNHILLGCQFFRAIMLIIRPKIKMHVRSLIILQFVIILLSLNFISPSTAVLYKQKCCLRIYPQS